MSYDVSGNEDGQTVSQFGRLVKSASGMFKSIFAGWFLGSGPLARLWSGFMEAYDAFLMKIKGGIEENPIKVFGIGVAVIAAAVLLAPTFLGYLGSGVARAAGRTARSAAGGLRDAIGGLRGSR